MGTNENLLKQSHASQATGVALSKFSKEHESPRGAHDTVPIKDTLSMEDGEAHKSVGQDGDALVKFGVDMSELSGYLDNIITVVNQHAKLLDKVSDELEARPKATEVGELFASLSQAYPYERALKQLKLEQHPPRTAEIMGLLSQHNVSLTANLA